VTLRQYALLADGERGALVGPRGEIAFLCAPRWHDGAVFASLVGGDGHYAVTPADDRFVWGGYYEPHSLVWRSRWVTTDGIIECREALAFPGEDHRLVLLRRIEPVDTDARLEVVLDLRAGFGSHGMAATRTDDGVWLGRSGPLHFRWQGAGAAVRREDRLECQLTVAAGDRHDLVLEISDRTLPDSAVSADSAWEATVRAWRASLPSLADSLGPSDVLHSRTVLRGLTSRHGGMVAAATTSLPERAEQGRNYDYRYSWIRDQCYAGQAAAVAGDAQLLHAAVGFVAHRLLEDGPLLKPAYTVDGGPVPEERSLDLNGYPGGSDRVGNRVNHQFQLDAVGEALLLFAAAARTGALDDDGVTAARLSVDVIAERWCHPDAGIWELGNRRWAHSRLIAAAGLQALAATGAAGACAADPVTLAKAILDDVEGDCIHPTGRWQRSPDDERVDAALLLPAIRGAVPYADPRSVATWRAVREQLGQDGYVYRFRQAEGPLEESEGAFLLCGFHMALATHQLGEATEAVRWFERNRAATGPPGLYSEEYDVVQRQLRGNLPQAFVHALLVESATRLAQPPRAMAELREEEG
jgi:GH15 family glucan-1,4-alpha-glucosidase